MDEQKKEIRKFLVGYYVKGENGLEAGTGVFNPFLSGLRSSAPAAFILGVTRVKHRFTYRGNAAKITELFDGKFSDIGRRFALKSDPEQHCVLVLPLIFNPYVYSLSLDPEKKGEATLYCYAVRGIFSYLKCRLRINKLLRRFDGVPEINTGLSDKRGKKAKKENKEKKAK